MKTPALLAFLAAATLLTFTRAEFSSGGSFAVVTSTIDCGGGTSSGGGFSVSGSIGQADAGILTGSAYQIEGGFWPCSIVPNPDVTLAMRPGPPGYGVLYWPVEVTGYELQWQPGLEKDAWTVVPFAITDNSTEHTVTVPATADRLFFRLQP